MNEISTVIRPPEGNPKYVVEIRIPDLVLVKLTRQQFEEFRDSWPYRQLELLGFTEWTRVTRYSDYPRCDKVFVISTNEVVKPSLFGHALPYSAEAL